VLIKTKSNFRGISEITIIEKLFGGDINE